MSKDTGCGAALTTFLAVAWLAGELRFLALYKVGLSQSDGLLTGASVVLLFLHLCPLHYGIARWLLLPDAARKPTHPDRQFGTVEGLHEYRRTHLPAVLR